MKETEMKQWIDNATYEQLLNRWRFAPVGSPWFLGDIGKYYSDVMFRKRDEDLDGAVQASKNIGWEK